MKSKRCPQGLPGFPGLPGPPGPPGPGSDFAFADFIFYVAPSYGSLEGEELADKVIKQTKELVQRSTVGRSHRETEFSQKSSIKDKFTSFLNRIQTLKSIRQRAGSEPNADYQFTTIQDAVDKAISLAPTLDRQVAIYIAPGVYVENVELAWNINLIGSGTLSTFIFGNITCESSEEESNAMLSDLTVVGSVSFSQEAPATANVMIDRLIIAPDGGAGTITIDGPIDSFVENSLVSANISINNVKTETNLSRFSNTLVLRGVIDLGSRSSSGLSMMSCVVDATMITIAGESDLVARFSEFSGDTQGIITVGDNSKADFLTCLIPPQLVQDAAGETGTSLFDSISAVITVGEEGTIVNIKNTFGITTNFTSLANYNVTMIPRATDSPATAVGSVGQKTITTVQLFSTAEQEYEVTLLYDPTLIV